MTHAHALIAPAELIMVFVFGSLAVAVMLAAVLRRLLVAFQMILLERTNSRRARVLEPGSVA